MKTIAPHWNSDIFGDEGKIKYGCLIKKQKKIGPLS